MSANIKYKLVLDAMGADSGPRNIVFGGVEAARRIGEGLEIVFVGRQEAIREVLDEIDNVPANISVQHAPDEVPMHISAMDGVRMRNSSVSVGLNLVKQKKAVAFISPGNTGTVMASALLSLGRMKGVSRPAICGAFPSSSGKPCTVLDVGANSDCKPLHLSQFAVMGAVYAEIAFNIKRPRVGLISIGEERSKGNELIFRARERLKSSKINFVGNIEGRDILSGDIDVAVTDGFTGNILLKFAESVKPLLVNAIQRQVETNLFSRFGAWLMLPFLRRMRSVFDYAERGGAPLLGVNGIVIICHGSSSDRAIVNAVTLAYEMARKNINQRIHEELATNHFGNDNDSENKSQNIRNGVICSATGNDQR